MDRKGKKYKTGGNSNIRSPGTKAKDTRLALRQAATREFTSNPSEYIKTHLSSLLDSHHGENHEIVQLYISFFQNFNEEEFKEKIGNDEAVKQSKIDLLEAVETQLNDSHKIELLKSLRKSRYLDDLNLSEILNAINLDDKNLVLRIIFEDGLSALSDDEKSNLLDIIQGCFEEELTEKNRQALGIAREYIATSQLETQLKALEITLPHMDDLEKGELCAFLLGRFSDHITSDEKLGVIKLIGLVSESGFVVDEHFTAKDDVIALLLVDLTTQAFNKLSKEKSSAGRQVSNDYLRGLIEESGFEIGQQTIFKSLQAKSLKEIMEYFNGGLDRSFADKFKDFFKAIMNFFLKLAGKEQYSYSAAKECSTFAEMIAAKQEQSHELATASL
jgi:hypothetical protein